MISGGISGHTCISLGLEGRRDDTRPLAAGWVADRGGSSVGGPSVVEGVSCVKRFLWCVCVCSWVSMF